MSLRINYYQATPKYPVPVLPLRRSDIEKGNLKSSSARSIVLKRFNAPNPFFWAVSSQARLEFNLTHPSLSGRGIRESDPNLDVLKVRGTQTNLPQIPVWQLLRTAGFYSYLDNNLAEADATPILINMQKENFNDLGNKFRKISDLSPKPSETEIRIMLKEDEFDSTSDILRLSFTKGQLDNLILYLQKAEFYLPSFSPENINKADGVLAFSFGEAEDVNAEIAKELAEIPDLRTPIYAQWEIADLLKRRAVLLDSKQRIAIVPGKNYITSKEVRDEFIGRNSIVLKKYPQKVFLACQAWHAFRCREICRERGLEVIGGIFVDKFSPYDPQPWVQDPFSWLIKEANSQWSKDRGLLSR